MKTGKKSYKRAFLTLSGLGIGILFLAILIQAIFNFQDDPGRISKNFNRVLHEKEKSADRRLKEFAETFSKPSSVRRENSPFKESFRKSGIAYYIFRNDSLAEWTSNAIPGFSTLPEPLPSPGVLHLVNGWYELRYLEQSPRVFAALILIRHQYPFENNYLINDFPSWFHVPGGTSISQAGMSHPVLTWDGKYLFNLVFAPSGTLTGPRELTFLLIYLTIFLLFAASLNYLYLYLEPIFPNKWFFVLSFSVDLLLLRFVQFYFHAPHILYNSELFGPKIFSSSILLPSLGDFLVNALVVLIIAYFIFRHLPSGFASQIKRLSLRIGFSIISLTLIYAGFWSLIILVQQLVVNSSIPLNLADISSLNLYSIAGIAIISILFLAFFMITYRLAGIFAHSTGLNTLSVYQRFRTVRFSLTAIVIYLLFFAILATLMLNQCNSIMERSKRQLLALKLGCERDPMAEMLFGNIESLLLHDSVLQQVPLNNGKSNDSLVRYIENRYFGEFWNNYFVQITVCQPGKQLQVQPQNYLIGCRDYFSGIIADYGKPTLCRHLYYLDYGFGYRNYLATIPIPAADTSVNPNAAVYIEISSRLVFKDLGYPELLMDKKQVNFPDVSGYSYAFYRNSKLIHRIGNYQYSLDLKVPVGIMPANQQFYLQDGMSHFYYPVDKNNVLLLSRRTGSLLDRIAPFSYLFFVFAFVVLIFCMIVRPSMVFNMTNLQLGQRFQLIMTALLISSLLILGFLTIYYIIRLNTSKNLENLEERTHSILVELQHRFSAENDITGIPQESLNEYLTKLSNVFFVDINLYSPAGRLISTSRSQVFEKGLISDLIDSRALSKLQTDHKPFFTQQEYIGLYPYYSSYMPFFNDRNQLMGYLNLPYFARQEDLRKEISTFLIAFINIYVFLIILGIFTALIISTYISRPLRMLSAGIGRLTLGGINEKLDWNRRDEIGKLVDEYNHMTDELMKSAELLARSEREMAWREMARQVAHEIKNPLTPMLLSVQHLRKAWKENASDREERLQRFCNTMIEQIETLSAISSEFSDFAKMPQTRNEQLDMKDQIGNILEIYRDYAAIRFEVTPTEDGFPFIGDRTQILRVFTNLINNSIQAIGKAPGGKIRIGLCKQNDQIMVTITDNGPGIPEEQRGRMFQPNFTTKSGGMGLGLAIVKSIITAAGGEINFRTETGNGTTFIIKLPEKRNDF
ncbi:MAG: ATP-binding protein [Bacteroidota bacterium]|nr:ATP-binding protein [Bacteroidota bacterium]